MKQLWVFDGDDTLWFVEALYDDARDAAALVVAEAGLDPRQWEKRQRTLDVANVARFGVSPERFPTSCVEAYEAEATDAGHAIRGDVVETVRIAAESVFHSVAPVHPEARRVVETLRTHGSAVLLTKGDESIQRRRIADADLGDAFDDIHIVAVKDESTFRRVLHQHGFKPSASWSIGNSLRSDINPALRVGMNTVWVDAHVWEYERAETMLSLSNARVVHNLRDVPHQVIGASFAIG